MQMGRGKNHISSGMYVCGSLECSGDLCVKYAVVAELVDAHA